jgi:hypothetical protein
VAQHKAADACSRAREQAEATAAAAAKQQLQAVHQEAEQKAASLLSEANAKASGLLAASLPWSEQPMLATLRMLQAADLCSASHAVHICLLAIQTWCCLQERVDASMCDELCYAAPAVV